MESEVNMSLTVFKDGNLIAFRDSDGYCFNVIELTGDLELKKVTPSSKVTLYPEDDEAVFQ